MEFVVPLHPEDLEQQKPGRLYVHAVLDVENCQNVDQVIDEVSDAVLNATNTFNTVLDHVVFDRYYSLVKYWSCHGPATKQRVIELAICVIQEVLGAVAETPLGHTGPEAAREQSLRRSAFKAAAYLFSTAVQVAEKTSQPSAEAAIMAGGKKGGKKAGGKKSKAAAEDEDEDVGDDGGEGGAGGAGGDSDAFDWPAMRETCLGLLYDTITVDMRKLWNLGVPDEEFVSCITKTALRTLTSAPAMKDKAARAVLMQLLATACSRFPSVVTSTVVALVDGVTKHEHVGPIVAELAQMWSAGGSDAGTGTGTGGNARIVGELLREIGHIDTADTKDTAGLRRAAAFISDVSERVPKLLLQHMSVLLPHLSSDSHALRSAVVTVLGNIISKSFNSATAAAAASRGDGHGDGSEGGDGSGAAAAALGFSGKTRDALLDVLTERAHDVNSYVRGAVLKAWTSLAENAAIPLSRLPGVTALAADRLRDKAAMVRKAAIALLRALLENNPFGPRIDPAAFSTQVAAAEQWLQTNAPAVWAQLTGAPASAGGGADAGGSKKPKRGMRDSGDDDEDSEEDGEGDAEAALAESLIADSAAAMAAEEAGERAEGAAATAAAAVTVTPETAAYVKAREVYTAAGRFAVQVAGAVPYCESLMASKTGSDVMESIRFLSQARSFGVPGAEGGLAKMLTLVWSEGAVREEVIRTFDKLYILNETLDEDDGAFGGVEAAAAAGGVGAEAEEGAAAAAAPAPAEPAARPKRASRGKASTSKSAAADDDDDDVEELAEGDDGDAGEEEGDDDEEEAGSSKRGSKGRKGATASKAAKPKAAPKPKAAAAKPRSSKAAAAAARDAIDARLVADNFVTLLSGATLSVHTSLEEVLKECTARDLLPNTVVRCLWDMVAYGVAHQQRTRVAIASTLAALSQPGQPAASSGAAAPQLQQLKTQVATAENILQRARRAMCVISIIAGAKPDTVDSMNGIARLCAILSPMRIPGCPQGLHLLRAAAKILGPSADLGMVELAVCTGDYRLARYACEAAQTFAGRTLAPPKRSAAVIAAEAASAAAAEAKAGKGKGSKKSAAAKSVDDDDEDADPEARAAGLDQLVAAIVCMLRGDWEGGSELENRHWFAAAQQGVDALFMLVPQPTKVCTELLQHMTAAALLTAEAPSSGSSGGAPTVRYTSALSRARLSRLFFVAGHVAMKLLVHVEALSARVKLLRIKASEKLEAAAQAKGGAGAAAAETGNKKAAATKGKEGKKGAAAAAEEEEGTGGKAAEKDGIEEQLGVSAAEDEKEAELVALIGERELTAANIGGMIAPLLTHVVTQTLGSGSAAAQTASAAAMSLAQSALLALCKFMAVSSDFCEAHLQLLFTVLTYARSPKLRGTIAIALGDLAFRFPNLIEPYTGHLYARLRDADPGVRKNTLLVLSHLILNDMVKIKGQVGEIAVCLNDPDPRIADLTRLFFTELSKRGNNPIYNILPDTLSCLSKLLHDPAAAVSGGSGAASAADEDEGEATGPGVGAAGQQSTLQPLDQETFRDVVRFLLGFINKDKQSEGLAEKLLHRFDSVGGTAVEEATDASSATRGLWRDVAYCLSQLPMSDKMAQKLAEGVKSYKHALADDDVWESFSSMLVKAKKLTTGSSVKQELRTLIEEWEKQLNEGRAGSVEDDAALNKARAVAKKARHVAAASGVDAAAIAAQALAAAQAAVANKTAAATAEAEAAKAAKSKSRKAATATSKKKKASSDDEDEEAGDENAPAPAAAGKKGIVASNSAAVGKPPTVPRGLKKKAAVESDDDEEAPAPARKGSTASKGSKGSKAAAADDDDAGSVASIPSSVGGSSAGSGKRLSIGVGPKPRHVAAAAASKASAAAAPAAAASSKSRAK